MLFVSRQTQLKIRPTRQTDIPKKSSFEHTKRGPKKPSVLKTNRGYNNMRNGQMTIAAIPAGVI